MANIKFSAMEVEYKELQRESQNARTLIAVICSFPFVCTITCVGCALNA